MKKFVFLFLSFFIMLSFKSSEGIEVKWDFSKYKKITYSYHQVMNMKINSFLEDHSGIEGNGNIELIVKDSQIAEINIIILNAERYELDSLGNKINESFDFVPPNLVIDGIWEDDVSKIKNSPEAELLVKSLFPVTKQIIKVGEQIDYPLNFRFNYRGGMLDSTGKSFFKILNREKDNCNIELEFDLVNPKEEDIENEIKCFVKGKSQIKYNIENQYFLEGNAQMTMKISETNLQEPEFEVNNQIEYKLISVE